MKTAAGSRRTKSVQEKDGKVERNPSRKSVRAVSVVEMPVNGSARKGQKKS